ncbi:DUF4365 domain-containing protein [Trichocoleus desertorum AS-A10]|uniref:DUF4365 domain-containing protein n=1 Tax=Trichocoleus desertorum TaxID=1481672 RepID=UPI003296C3FC
MTRLPKRTKSQKIGISAAELLNSVFSQFCNVIPIPQERDLGIDFICELMQEDHPTGKMFNVQCKGKEEVEIKGDEIRVQISVTTLNYWLLQKNPTFLVVVDYQNYIFYWSFPKNFLDSLDKNWQEQQKVSIPVPIQNSFSQDVNTLPTQLLSIVDTQSLAPPQHGDYLGTLTLQFDRSSSTTQMTIKGLMHYYLEGSRIANVKCAYGSPGSLVTAYPETFGGEGYNTEVKARVWGDLKGEAAILLQMPVERNYILSYSTFQEICYLLSVNLSDCETHRDLISHGGFPGGNVSVTLEGKLISAKAWYEVPLGRINLFKVNNKWYAISLVGIKTISTEKTERRTGSYLNHDPRRDIIWHYFDLSGYPFSLPLKFQNTL